VKEMWVKSSESWGHRIVCAGPTVILFLKLLTAE
jgi:hypothetical protein